MLQKKHKDVIYNVYMILCGFVCVSFMAISVVVAVGVGYTSNKWLITTL